MDVLLNFRLFKNLFPYHNKIGEIFPNSSLQKPHFGIFYDIFFIFYNTKILIQ